jgi:integrating conjugative element protein (TIGR03755 family)
MIDRIRWTVLAVALGLPLAAGAQLPSSPDSSWLYYEIGGGQAYTRAPNPTQTSVTIGAGAELGLGYSCGAFDPVMSVTNQLNQLRDGIDALSNQMVAAANAAIAALPAYILQRANPGLYDLFQNALLRAEESFQLATKTCEQMEAEIARGHDPWHEWVVLSKGHSWRRAMGTGASPATATSSRPRRISNSPLAARACPGWAVAARVVPARSPSAWSPT